MTDWGICLCVFVVGLSLKRFCGIWGLEPFLEGLGFKIEEWTYGWKEKEKKVGNKILF